MPRRSAALTLGVVDGRGGTTAPLLRSVERVLHDTERLAGLYSAALALSSETTLDGALNALVHSACSLVHADRVTFTLYRPEPSVGGVVWSGCGGESAEVALERELMVADEPYGVLRVMTRRRLTAEDEALVELLCIHVGLAAEKLSLRTKGEVVRQVRALVGEHEPPTNGTVRHVGNIHIDHVRHEAFLRDLPLHLTPSEFRLLELLTEEPGRVYTRNEIVMRLWGTDRAAGLRVADAHVTRLRRKLEQDRSHTERLESVRGVGYKLVTEEEIRDEQHPGEMRAP